ncbi:amino acid adenylation domain-containing protein [uncultured Cyclobacterium sp.]|uniref:amino acid adenylation domain-containing protein n=1 Tax=uncultured Cyclobacterium sp. TaxID=453820 RepID=UPI0030EBC9A8|tara:strand:+ start:1649 stop:10558 length:8910 start_codon:yes stop_codon:yes gene_type:complete
MKVLNFHGQINNRQPEEDYTLIDLFLQMVGYFPTATVIREGKNSYTYSDLDKLSSRVCSYIINADLKNQEVIPLSMERSYHYIAAILGIVKSGKAFAPINPEWPENRKHEILNQLGVNILLTDNDSEIKEKQQQIINLPFSRVLREAGVDLPSRAKIKEGPLAYIMYTSGSTGEPKGVMVGHQQLFHAIQSRIKYYACIPHLLLIPPLTFDASLAAIFWPLCTGGSLVISPIRSIQEPELLPSLFQGTDTLLCVPSYYRFLLEHDLLKGQQLQRVILGGERLPDELASSHFLEMHNVDLYNEYGPTEATIWSTVAQIKPDRDQVTIGRPVPGVVCYVLDQDGCKVPMGALGELYIGGPQVALGYWKDPALTAALFLPNPFDGDKGGVMYATGDMVRILPDGSLVFEGRKDRQVKFQGNRVDLIEIEKAALETALVKEAFAILSKPTNNSPEQIVLFVVSGTELDPLHIKEVMAQRLPSYMLPGKIEMRESFPLTENGKVNQAALIPSSRKDDSTQNEFIADPELRFLQEAFDRVLGLENTGQFLNFFEAGGNSLAAMRLAAHLKKERNLQVSVSDIFNFPTIAQLHKLTLSRNKLDVETTIRSIPQIRTAASSVSFAQQSLWFIDKLEGSLAYHLPVTYLLTGKLDAEKLEWAIRAVMKRHEILKTCFLDIDQVTLKSEEGWNLLIKDFSEESYSATHSNAILAPFFQSPFDLKRDFMVRGILIKYSDGIQILGFVFHHIAFDDYSMKLFVKELSENYQTIVNGTGRDHTSTTQNYTWYLQQQQKLIDTLDYKAGMSFWEEALAGWNILQLPKDFKKPSTSPRKVGTQRFFLDREEIGPIASIAKESEASLFMAFLAVFKVLLYRYSNQKDICVGVPVVDRNWAGTEELIGYFVNTLPLRSKINTEENFGAFIKQIREEVLLALEFSQIPFTKLVESFASRNKSGEPFFNVLFVMHDGSASTEKLLLPGLDTKIIESDPIAAKYDITFTLSGDNNGINGTIEYDLDLFVPDRMQRMFTHFKRLMQELPKNVGKPLKEIALLSNKEIDELSGRKVYKKEEIYQSFFERFKEQVSLLGNAPALLLGENHLGFSDLEHRANQFAGTLRREGVKRGDHVVLLVQRGMDMVAAMLGIWKAGAAYVPVDLSYPKERIAFILADCNAYYIVTDTDSGNIPELPERRKVILLSEAFVDNSENDQEPLLISAKESAYLIYTSGSTGKPKGVNLTHGNLAAFLDWCGKEFSPNSFGLMYAATSICFDLSIFELFFPLAYGKTTRILQNGLQIPEYLHRDERVLINTVPSLVQKLVEAKVDLSNVSLLNMAGEPIPTQLTDRLDLRRMTVRNLYGPTEDTTYSTCVKLTSGRSLSIGRPIAGSFAYILNPDRMPCPVGIPGEIYLGGKGLAAGYLNRPELTAEKFILNPLAEGDGNLLYQTGDLGLWCEDGSIDFLGRLDNQVKLNGYRIELDEVSAILESLEGVENAVVVLQNSSSGEKVLAAFVTGDKSLDKKRLVDNMKNIVPPFMVPSRLERLDKLPLTPNGKIDRKKLESAVVLALEGDGFEAPTTLLESQLLDLWRKVIHSDKPGIKDDFFLSGGNSLLAIKMVGKIKESIGVEISISELFSNPTVSGIASIIQHKEQKETEISRILPFRPRPAFIPLSYGQESLWLIDKLEGSSQYHVPVLLKIKGESRRLILQEAIQSILERHEVLRTVIKEKGEEASQQIMPVLGWELSEASEDINYSHSNFPDEDIAELLERPFDLEKDFMIRAKLYPIGSDECLLLVIVHHIAFDGWSIPVFIKELFALVNAEKSGESLFLPHLKIQYTDYALWQRDLLTADVLEEKLVYWKSKLDGIKPLNLLGEGESFKQRSHKGETFDFIIDPRQNNRMLNLGQQLGISPFIILLAAFKSLIGRSSGQEDLCVGTAMGLRKQVEAEPLIGYFVNPLPIRSILKPEDSFKEILLEVKKNTLEAFDHQDVPFEKIVAASAQNRRFGENPLFQVMFVMEFDKEVFYKAEGLSMEVMPISQNTSKFDLTFIAKETADGNRIRIEYAKDLFDVSRIKSLASQYQQLLEAALADPNQKLSSLIPNPTFKGIGMIEEDSVIRGKYTPIQRLIEAAVNKHESKAALLYRDRQVSYKDLNGKANQLAGHLLRKGLKKGQIVGIVLDRSPEFLISILGILKAGGAYLPLDTDYPRQRIEYILDDSCKFFIAASETKENLKTKAEKVVWEDFIDNCENYSEHNLSINPLAEDPAYIIYTSGTTGKPKGVILEHLNLFNFVSVVREKPGVSEEDKVLAVSSVSFDIALLETLVSLAYGAQIVILDKEQCKEPRAIIGELEKREITIMFATPSHWKMLLEGGWTQRFEGLRMISGGEPLEKKLAFRLLTLGEELWNVYGPTETTVYSNIKRIHSTDSEITVGKPVLNTQILILNKDGDPVQKGRKGEIFISGHGVGRGYLNRPALTQERFLKNRNEGGGKYLMFKSGDLGWINRSDELVVSGRIDHQVKIRGYRIELAEVESEIRQLEGVSDAIVLVRKDSNGEAYLKAYITQFQKGSFNDQEWQYLEPDQVRIWKDQLGLTLANYMIPRDFLWLKTFALLENGKVNRKGLPDPERLTPLSEGEGFVLDPHERLVADIWKKALGLPLIDKNDNFFEIGGHSLIAVKVMVQLEKVYGIRLPLSVLFKYPTIQKLSQAIKSGVLGNSEWKCLVAIKKSGTKPPLYIVHGGGLNIMPFYAVAREMDREQPVFGIQAKGLDGVEQPLHTVEAIASQYLEEVLQQNPQGPYFLAGYSLGGIIAYEMAIQLVKMGKVVEKLVLFDTYAFQSDRDKSFKKRLINNLRHVYGKRKFDVELLLKHPAIFKRIKKASWRKKFQKVQNWYRPEEEKAESSLLKTYKRVEYVYKEACKEYEISYYNGEVDLIKARIASGYLPDKENFGWKPYVEKLNVWETEGEHSSMISPPNDTLFASLLQQLLDRESKI